MSEKPERYIAETGAPRSSAQADAVHEMTLELLAKRGIAAERATYDEYVAASEIAAEIVQSDKATLAERLAEVALPADTGTPDVMTTRVLARFAVDGKFVSDLSVTEEEFLEAAIAAEQAREDELGVVTPSRLRDPIERDREDRRIAAEAADDAFTADGAYRADEC